MQAQTDARIDAAVSAYSERDRTRPIVEQIQLWEDLWEACDFSWQGLADIGTNRPEGTPLNFSQSIKRWNDGRTLRSLQEYWRMSLWSGGKFQRTLTDDEMLSTGLLVEYQGKLWHSLFLRIPTITRVVWNDLQDRADAANVNNFGVVPLFLTGTRATPVFEAISPLPESNRKIIVYTSLAELTQWRAGRMKFGDKSNFSNSLFVGQTNFWSADFGATTSFDGSLFTNRTFFQEANFGTNATFAMCSFASGAVFTGARFAKQSTFRGSCFFESTSFVGSTFADQSSFEDVKFLGNLVASNATFGPDCSFQRAFFKEKAVFYKATFDEHSTLRGAEFKSLASFAEAKFAGSADFNWAQFGGKVDFRAADFQGHAGFAECTWPERLADQRRALQGCRFRDVADFRTSHLSAFAIFDGAELKGRTLLTDPGGQMEDVCFADALKSTELGAQELRSNIESHISQTLPQHTINGRHDGLQLALASLISEKEKQLSVASSRDQAFAALAGGLRTLKQAMAIQGDREREQRFFRYEVQARERRPSEGLSSKFAAKVYGLTSDYGMSAGRPVVWIFGLIFSFAAVFLVFGLVFGELKWATSLNDASQALELSVSNSFRPFFILETPAELNKSFWAELLAKNNGTSLLMRAVGIIQSISVVILVFLVGLALKRKFQVA